MFILCSLYVTGTKVVAYRDTQLLPFPTIRHSECEMLLERESVSDCCSACSEYQHSLCSLLSRERRAQPREDRTHPSSHVRYDVLSSPEKIERMHRLHALQRSTSKQLERLRTKLTEATQKEGVDIDEATQEDLANIVSQQSSYVEATHPPGTFQRLFWEQQKQATTLKDARSRRWHPTYEKVVHLPQAPLELSV